MNVGHRIARKRREKGLTQEELIERVGDEGISLSTLKRIESGKNRFDMARIQTLCLAMDCALQDVISEDEDYLDIEQHGEMLDEDDVENYKDMQYRQRLFYPKPIESIYYENRKIKTLMQFIIYFPLMDDYQTWEAFRRIEGDIFGNESYVLDKLQNLFDDIPDSKAKHYADYAAGKCTYDYFTEYCNSSITEADKLWYDPEKREEMYSCYQEYIKILEKKKSIAAVLRILRNSDED